MDDTAAAAAAAASARLKHLAESQMRREAPPLSEKQAKRQKVAAGGVADAAEDEEGEEHTTALGRFAYAADSAIAAGSTCIMASCGFNRQRSAAKELLGVIKPLLPEGVQVHSVKVGCRGLTMMRLQAPGGDSGQALVPVVDLLGQILGQIESGKLQHTRFCERIVPAETTCLLTAAALEAALTRVVTRYLDKQHLQEEQQDKDQDADADGTAKQQPALEFAVLYKSRGVDAQILAELAEMEMEAAEAAAADTAAEAAPPQTDQQQQQQEQEAQAADSAAAAAAAGGGAAAQQAPQVLDRQRVLQLAAGVMAQCCKDRGGSKVNLSKPQVVLLVEVVPLLRQVACAVSVLPSSVMSGGRKRKIRPTSLEGSEGGGGGQKGQRHKHKRG